MRFLRLDLRAFGPFAGAPPIELGGGDRGLHLIHGPNEAGKSTALRAIRCLLFGFPLRSVDDHLHKYDKLRVGAAIRGKGGQELSFVRRKRDVKPLWTFDDATAIDPDALSPFLGDLDEAKFVDLFSMDHAELVSGGRSILRGGGRLGEMLFAAGSGLARVAAVREALDAEMDELFKPRASNPAINAALAELKGAREGAERAMLATTSWVELDATKSRMDLRKAEVDAEIRDVEVRKRRLEALRAALPVIARRDEAARGLAAMAGVPVLSEGFADRRRDASAAREAGLKAARAAEEALGLVEADLATLGPRDPALDQEEAIRRLRDDLGLYRKAVEGRPADLARLARIEDDARALIADHRPGGPPDGAEPPRVPASTRERIQALAQELIRLDDGHARAEAELARRREECPGGGGVPVADAPRVAEALADAADRARALGDLDERLASARADLAEAERQVAVDLRGLPLWSGTLEELEALTVPSAATLDRFDAGLRAADEALGRAVDALSLAEAERAALDREIEHARLGGPAPTEEELSARRLGRDEAWSAIRRAWLRGEPVADPPGLADDFEARLRAADGLADRLRREADLVAEQAQRGLRRRELSDRVAGLAAARDRAERDRVAVARGWAELWGPTGLDPLPPREMKGWVDLRRADLVRKAQGLRDRRLDVARRNSKVEEVKAELARHLARLGEPAADPLESLAALLGRSWAAVDRVCAASRLGSAREALEKAEAARDAWRGRWASAVGPLGLDGDASPAQAQAVIGRLDDLAGLLRQAREVREEIAERARVEARFDAAVGELVDRLAPELAGRPVEAAARELAARLERAQVSEARREGALGRRDDERARRSEARAAVDRADAALAALVLEARCGSPEGLPGAERASDEVKKLAALARELDAQLATLAGAVPIDRLRAEAEGAGPETLDARIAELADRLAPLESERSRLDQEIGRCGALLQQMDGGPAAADARQSVEERIARLAVDVERYARLRLASAVLREAVERYRKEHQGPVLDRAGGLFARLTAGSFAGLRADVDEKGQPVLRGVRAGGATLLDVEAMSEGTADQLYLALRLASLETYLDDPDHEPIPLVVDDILVNFDNARARAALEALAALSWRTQVLFFTHHEHLVDLARSSLGDDVLFVHQLARGTPRPEAEAEAEPTPAEAIRPQRKRKASPMAGEG